MINNPTPKQSLTFRFDDVCIQSDMINTYAISNLIKEMFPQSRVIFAVSPLVYKSEDERVFPKIWNACSDYRVHMALNMFGIPNIPTGIDRASHGLFHCDSRLLTYEEQQMSILLSCSLVNAKIFVPPFNKWDVHTELICKEYNIELIKFEQGYLCAEYNAFNPDHNLWYLHAREFTIETFTKWIQNK